MRSPPLLLALLVVTAALGEEEDVFPEEHTDIVFINKVKYESHIRNFDLPLHSLINETDVVPLSARVTRRKRCSCGCSGCDVFPDRSCCSSDCCSSAALPLACCPPPPPPKPCCQPAYGPCCPATPNCCPKPCCKGRRPEYEEYEEGAPNTPPAPPSTPRTCCPAAVPPPPPPPPAPPPPPPEAPVQCCSGQQQPRTPCNSCQNGDCGCGRPCCYYKNPNCCDQVTGVIKPCCPPTPPPLPCCPDLSVLTNCVANVPPCLRACPTCPCRKRLALGKRSKRHDNLHCQPAVSTSTSSPPAAATVKAAIKTKVAAAPTFVKEVRLPLEEGPGVVQSLPRAGRLYEEHRALRVKRAGCGICLGGRPIIRREKRSLDCQRCTYLQPQATNADPFAQPALPQSPVGIPHKRVKRNCLPHPECTLGRRKRNAFGSQYCEPCMGGYYGRKKREAERDQCLRRDKRGAEQCDNDEFDINARMKRQAYNPKGMLDIIKVLSKGAVSEASGTGTCMKFPACVLASKKRRKRDVEIYQEYHQAVAEHQKALEEHAAWKEAYEEQLIRTKRQFFAPDNAGNCVPCPAWVTLALASRKKREADGNPDKPMTLKEAIADIRKKKGYQLGFNDESPRRKQRKGSCDQTEDCLNEVEYAIFKKVYHERTKREAVFRRKKCEYCGSGFNGKRTKRSFGGPDINASEHNCMSFPQCRHRHKRSFLGDDCNVCTPHLDARKRKKRNAGSAQCYPCPGTGK